MLNREQIEMIVWHYEPLHRRQRPLVNREEWVEKKVDETIANMLKKCEKNWDDLTLHEQNEEIGWHTSNAHMTFDGMVGHGEMVCEKRWKEQGPFYVTCVRWDSCFGGPEEGGWYYSAPSLVKWCAVPTYEMGKWLAETLNEKAKEKTYRPVYSALGGDDTVSSTYPEGYIPRGWVGDRDIVFRVSHEACQIDFERPHYE